ncbi:MAG: amidoligase family protein [Pseudomonadota bacterium]
MAWGADVVMKDLTGLEMEVVLPPERRLLGGIGGIEATVGLLRKETNRRAVDGRFFQDKHERAQAWVAGHIIVDSELSIHPPGVEVVLPPLDLEEEIKLARHVAVTLANAGYTTNESTSLQANQGAKGMGLQAIKRLLANGYINEDLFDRIVAPDRQGANAPNYADTLRQGKKPDLAMRVIDTARASNELTTRVLHPENGDFYGKVNINKLALRGAVEWRQHEGTLDPDAIENWARLTRALTDYSRDQEVVLTPQGELPAVKRGDLKAVGAALLKPPIWTDRERFNHLMGKAGQPVLEYYQMKSMELELAHGPAQTVPLHPVSK